MITNSVKRDFLIIGLTGPLGSGCTTAADFFVNELHDIKSEFTSDSGQGLIQKLYQDLAHLLKAEELDSKLIKKNKKELTELLRKRELKKALNSHVVPVFNYISMSNMILKYILEEFVFKEKLPKDLNQQYEGIINLFSETLKTLDVKTITEINNNIKEKKYNKISPDYCDIYDNYLKELNILKTKIKANPDYKILNLIMQNFGDNIRKNGDPFDDRGEIKSGNECLIAEEANCLIKFFRNRIDGKDTNHFIVECFRNPSEVEFFRNRYYEFYLLSLFADFKTREKRRTEDYNPLPLSQEMDDRDSGEKNKTNEIYKQNVSRCVYLSDIAINNENNNEGSLKEFYGKLIEYYALMLNPGCVTPTFDETFMNQAYSLSLRSSCLSRQVGAVIVGKNGYVVGAGWNDPGDGQIGCGYRQIVDIENLSSDILPTNPDTKKERFFRKHLINQNLIKFKSKEECICFKDAYSRFVLMKESKKIIEEHEVEFKEFGIKGEDKEKIGKWLIEDMKIKRLEYCRALHAEENALLQTSKIGGVGVKGGKIFTTTFPCELCAKKIYQAGIEEIVFTEPYPESISKEVFLEDSVSKKKIKQTQFEGVKSHSYFRLYKANMDKKERQEIEKI